MPITNMEMLAVMMTDIKSSIRQLDYKLSIDS